MSKQQRLRVLSRLQGTPLLIKADKLQLITEAFTLEEFAGTFETSLKANEGATQKSVPQTVSGKLGIVKVFDSLVAKNASMWSGETSYQTIRNQTEQLITDGASEIVYYIDSPGGEALGLFSLMSYIQSLPSRGIRTSAFTDGVCCSAAYGLASACQEIYATDLAYVGSIGAVMAFVDVTEADKQRGYKYEIFRSKELKAIVNPHEGLSDPAKEKLQKVLAECDDMFNNEVLKGRKTLSLQAITDMKGADFVTKEALDLKLIDGVSGSFEDFISAKMQNTTTSGVFMKTNEQLQAELQASQKEVATLKANLETIKTTAYTAGQTDTLNLLEESKKLHLNASFDVIGFIKASSASGLTGEQIKTQLGFHAKALAGASEAVDTSTDPSASMHNTDKDQKPALSSLKRGKK